MDLDIPAMERKWMSRWEKIGLYRFEKSSKPVFSIDTPPPTVSGRMHIGHAFSYPQQDFTARFKRMRGYNVFYPWGFDDNGLATERFTEKKIGVRGSTLPLGQFREMVKEATEEAEADMLKSWKSLGISATFEHYYRTVSNEVMKASQKFFLDLARNGSAFTSEGPTMWCPACRTAISQSDLKDMERQTDFVRIAFSCEGKELVIATTRPELMGACVVLAANPQDKRYQGIVGKQARIPLYGFEVPVIADESVDPAKGTGIEMVCTFGDQNDMELWRRKGLQTRIIISRDGKIADSGVLDGLSINAAKKTILEKLEAGGLIRGREKKKQNVNVHERCDTPIEILVSRQWFIRTMSEKENLIGRGGEIRWVPEYMRTRFENWVNGMKWDWCVSRQRFYGVPFPVWYCNSCAEVILADEKELPVDPAASVAGRKCLKCGSSDIRPESDVMDTWLTSSISTYIATMISGLPHETVSVRFQAHDIISTWAYTSIVRGHHNFSRIPWKDIVISGLVYDPTGEKVSKSRGNSLDLPAILEKYGADALRYWASGTITGDDIAIREQDFVRGRRSVIKIYNASKLVSMMADGAKPDHSLKNIRLAFNRWIIGSLENIISEVTDSLENYAYSRARTALDNFFWNTFCDNYLEIAKAQISVAKAAGNGEEISEIINVASYSMLQILRMFAPFLPFISDEAYEIIPLPEKLESISLDSWPDQKFEGKFDSDDFAHVLKTIDQIRAFKSSRKLSPGSPLETIMIKTPDDLEEYVPLLSSMFRIGKIVVSDSEELLIE